MQLVCTFAVLALVVAPPARGKVLIVPLGGQAASALVGEAKLVGAGPLPGSLIMEAERADLLLSLWRRGLVAVAATGRGCADEAK